MKQRPKKTRTQVSQVTSVAQVEPGTRLFDQIVRVLQTYIDMPIAEIHAIAAWVLFSWFHDQVDFVVSPFLLVTSPVAGCGKTTLAEIIMAFTKRPRPAAFDSPASLFRDIDDNRPCTLILDNQDKEFQRNRDLQQLLDASYRRIWAIVRRTIGGQRVPFNTWCPKFAAKNDAFPHSIQERGILISLQRRKQKAAWSTAFIADYEPLRQELEKWSKEPRVVKAIQTAYALTKFESLPCFRHSREADNWKVLRSVAAIAGRPVLQAVEAAALNIKRVEEEDEKIALLRDIREILNTVPKSTNPKKVAITTTELTTRLAAIPDRPWRKLTPVWLARTLNHGFGIRATQTSVSRQRGFFHADFEDAFKNYL